MQEEFQAKIFTIKPGFDWRLNSSRLFFGGFIFLILFLIFAQTFEFDLQTVQSISFFLFVLIMVGSRWGYNEKQKKFGKIEGELRINDNSISIHGIGYELKEISNLAFNLLQVLDEQLWSESHPISRYYGGPAFSQGVDNYINFNFRNQQLKVHFQLETPSHKAELSNILKRHFFLGHIELQPTYDGLHLDYEQIQELKKRKLEWTKEKSS